MVTSETHMQCPALKRFIKNLARTNKDLEVLMRKRSRELFLHYLEYVETFAMYIMPESSTGMSSCKRIKLLYLNHLGSSEISVTYHASITTGSPKESQ